MITNSTKNTKRSNGKVKEEISKKTDNYKIRKKYFASNLGLTSPTTLIDILLILPRSLKVNQLPVNFLQSRSPL